jgi:hypothetical protein
MFSPYKQTQTATKYEIKNPKLLWKKQWKLQRTLKQQVSETTSSSTRSTTTPVDTPKKTSIIESTITEHHYKNAISNVIKPRQCLRSGHICDGCCSQTSKAYTNPISQQQKVAFYSTQKRKLDEIVSSNARTFELVSMPNFKIRKLQNGKVTQHPRVKNALSYVF